MRKPFPASYTTLCSSALLETIQREYDLPVIACDLFSRCMNDIYRARTRTSCYFVRVSRASWRTHDDIAFETAALSHLVARRAPVVGPVARKNGQLWLPISAQEGEKHAVLFAAAEGRAFDWSEPEQFFYYGRALAAIHEAGSGFAGHTARLRPDFIVEHSLATVERFLEYRPAHLAYLERLAGRLLTKMAALEREGLNCGLCHGDSMGGNAHLAGNSQATFFDFDCCGIAPRAYDLGTFRWSNWNSGTQEPRQWSWFLQGYQEHRRLSEADMRAIPLCVALRGIWILWYHASNADHFGLAETDARYFDRRVAFLKEWEATHL